MVAFLEDPNNAEEAIKLGLAEPKNAPANTPEEAKPPTV
jgi:hypothetical protein